MPFVTTGFGIRKPSTWNAFTLCTFRLSPVLAEIILFQRPGRPICRYIERVRPGSFGWASGDSNPATMMDRHPAKSSSVARLRSAAASSATVGTTSASTRASLRSGA